MFKNLPKELRLKIFAIAKGKLIYFPKNQGKKPNINQKEVLRKYAKSNKSYNQIGNELGVTKARICQIVKQERENFSKERIIHWKNQGLSLRNIARLFKKSHETVRGVII